MGRIHRGSACKPEKKLWENYFQHCMTWSNQARLGTTQKLAQSHTLKIITWGSDQCNAVFFSLGARFLSTPINSSNNAAAESIDILFASLRTRVRVSHHPLLSDQCAHFLRAWGLESRALAGIKRLFKIDSPFILQLFLENSFYEWCIYVFIDLHCCGNLWVLNSTSLLFSRAQGRWYPSLYNGG